jgi:hypothetical protein
MCQHTNVNIDVLKNSAADPAPGWDPDFDF